MNITEEEIERRKAESAAKRSNIKKCAINNSEILKENGLRIVHLQKKYSSLERDMTIAYKQMGKSVEIATSICHPKDNFTKKIGTRTAVDAFLSGKTVKLPLMKGGKALDTIIGNFCWG